jgi:hypothetical protein
METYPLPCLSFITLITYQFSCYCYSSLVLLAFVLACACVPLSPHPIVHVLLAYQHQHICLYLFEHTFLPPLPLALITLITCFVLNLRLINKKRLNKICRIVHIIRLVYEDKTACIRVPKNTDISDFTHLTLHILCIHHTMISSFNHDCSHLPSTCC